jgi:soluble lytic murein transglycosylase
MLARRSKHRLCGLVLLLGSVASAPLGGSAVSESSRARAAIEARERVELEMLHVLVREHCRSADPSWRRHLVEVIHRESTAAGVDPLLVAAIVARESSFRSRVVSRAGAVGLMQLRPFVARDVARRVELEWREHETLRRPESNVRLGVTYYRELVDRFEGDPRLALAAYHRGPTRVERELRRGAFAGSGYASRVLELYGELDALRRGRLSGQS